MSDANSTIQTTSACRIERVIYRLSGNYKEAHFIVHQPAMGGAHWFAAMAKMGSPQGDTITPWHGSLDAEHAAAMVVALQMAIEWITGENNG